MDLNWKKNTGVSLAWKTLLPRAFINHDACPAAPMSVWKCKMHFQERKYGCYDRRQSLLCCPTNGSSPVRSVIEKHKNSFYWRSSPLSIYRAAARKWTSQMDADRVFHSGLTYFGTARPISPLRRRYRDHEEGFVCWPVTFTDATPFGPRLTSRSVFTLIRGGPPWLPRQPRAVSN